MGDIVNFPKNVQPPLLNEASTSVLVDPNVSVIEHHHYHHYPEEIIQQNSPAFVIEEDRYIGMFSGFFHVIMSFLVMVGWLLRIVPIFFSFLSSIVILIGAWLIYQHWNDLSYHAGFKLFTILFACFVILLFTENYKSPLNGNELMKYFVFLLIFLSPLLASADASKGAQNTYSEKVLHIGEVFSVSLPSNRTTGYEWKIAEKPKFLKLISSKYTVRKDCKKGMTGCGGEQTFRLKATQIGSGAVTLNYLRPWEKSPAQTKEISVVVQKEKKEKF